MNGQAVSAAYHLAVHPEDFLSISNRDHHCMHCVHDHGHHHLGHVDQYLLSLSMRRVPLYQVTSASGLA